MHGSGRERRQLNRLKVTVARCTPLQAAVPRKDGRSRREAGGFKPWRTSPLLPFNTAMDLRDHYPKGILCPRTRPIWCGSISSHHGQSGLLWDGDLDVWQGVHGPGADTLSALTRPA